MSKRNIAQEIIKGLEEIKAWKRGELKLGPTRSRCLKLPTCRQFERSSAYRNRSSPALWASALALCATGSRNVASHKAQRAPCSWSPQSSLLRCSRPWRLRNLSSAVVRTRWLPKANPCRPARQWARVGMRLE